MDKSINSQDLRHNPLLDEAMGMVPFAAVSHKHSLISESVVVGVMTFIIIIAGGILSGIVSFIP